jgi:hypothetical protein
MKKFLIGLVLTAFIISCSSSLYASPGKFIIINRHHDGPPPHQRQFTHEQENARYIIHRTATILFDAQRAAMHGHRSMGLALAIATQSRARELYFNRYYRDAIFHSLRARDLAFRIIRDNRRRVNPAFFPDEVQKRYTYDRPSDEDLDREHNRRRIGSDDDAVHVKVEFDIH